MSIVMSDATKLNVPIGIVTAIVISCIMYTSALVWWASGIENQLDKLAQSNEMVTKVHEHFAGPEAIAEMTNLKRDVQDNTRALDRLVLQLRDGM